MGRAVRSPPRDAMLSRAAGQTGLGWGFGLHQALDQTGAVVGPLVVSGVLFLGNDYRAAFAVLLAPALVSISLVLAARVSFPRPHDFDLAPPSLETAGLPPTFRVYLVAVAFIAAGYSDFALIAYHFGKAAATWIPMVYAIAMAVDGAAGLALGSLFDRVGLRAMIVATVISVAATPLVSLGEFMQAVLGMVCWGIGTGAQEPVMRARIAQLAPRERRATAFGIFNAVYGVAWFADSVLLGILYDLSIASVVIASTALQAAALPVLYWLAHRRVRSLA
jgi:MFS family permease